MSYYKLLGLKDEPFSTSPDPRFFYRSASHDTALKRLEIAIRLRRGLSLIIGEVGAGKTTLCRLLSQVFKDEQDYIFHIILDPCFENEQQFLTRLCRSFGLDCEGADTVKLKESLERYLFDKGVNEGKTVVLLVDEGQKLSRDNIEVLRTLLNYETNEYKLLQVVIFAQTEITAKLQSIQNFTNRVALRYTINPLDEGETGQLIRFRLKQAGLIGKENLFDDEAVKFIYQRSLGCPRSITMMAHDALELLIMKDKDIVDGQVIRELADRETGLEVK